jgi:hypothetical protein
MKGPPMQHAAPMPADAKNCWPTPLIEALERQRVLVMQLAQMARTQPELIAERHTDRLLELLSRRQSIIDEFTVCQSQVNALTRDLDRRLQDIAPLQRDRIRVLIDAIGAGLSDIMQRDQADQDSLQTGRSAVLAEMADINAGRTARAAYIAPARSPVHLEQPRFADQKG